jgi:hypothetical protein
MSLESVLSIVRERGLKIRLDEKAILYLKGGTDEDRSPALFDALKRYRQRTIDLIKSGDGSIKDLIHKDSVLPAPQPGDERVVLLSGDRDSEVDQVLTHHSKGGHLGALKTIQDNAKHYKGRTLAIEMNEVNRETGCKEWRRFYWRWIDAESNQSWESGEVNPNVP